MTIECEVRAVTLTNDRGRPVDGVEATCSQCDHCESAYGESDRSIRRALAMLRENCPRGEENYYVETDSED